MSNPPRVSDEELERQCRIIGTKVRSYDLGFDTEKPTDDERMVLIYAESLSDARARIVDLERERDEARSGVEHFRNSMYAVEADVRLANADRDRLAAELATAQRERDEARALEYRKVKLGGMSLLDQINRARSQRDELADDLVKAQADLAALRLAHDQVSAALLEASGEIARLRNAVEPLIRLWGRLCLKSDDLSDQELTDRLQPMMLDVARAYMANARIAPPAPADSGVES